MNTIICKSCGKVTPVRYGGYCQVCWRYFKVDKYKEYPLPEFGKVAYVKDPLDTQYGMVICHICGKAYMKLQQHIYYSHNIYKKDYCAQFGLDKKVRLTSEVYHNKMKNYAYKYNMPEQLKITGINTRFKRGHVNTYIRSPMTIDRLKNNSFKNYHKNKKSMEV